MSAIISIAVVTWVFVAVPGAIAMVLCFAIADSDDERDRAAGLALVWPLWLSWQIGAAVSWWATRRHA